MRKYVLRGATLGLVAVSAALASANGPATQADAPTKEEGQKRVNAASKRFTENKGQWDSRARFLARTPNMNYWITRDGVVIDHFRNQVQKGKEGIAGHVIGMSFEGGAKAPASTGVMPHRMKADYLNGDSGIEARGVRSFKEVSTRGVYPGVDVRSYFSEGRPRYDLIVAPGADTGQIRLAFKGASSLKVDAKGDLVIRTQIGDLKHQGLYAYQMVGGAKKRVPASFEKLDADTVAIRVGSYDTTRKLVIDPLVYGSYYGGDQGVDEVHAIVSDIDGAVYMTGRTRSARFPAIFGPYGFVIRGGWDAFFTKFQGDVYSHDYAAFVGGNMDDSGDTIQKDPFGNVWMAGKSLSTDYPGNTKNNVVFLQGDVTATGGTFDLYYDDIPMTLPWNATAADVQAALIGIGLTPVSVTGGPLPGGPPPFPPAIIRIELPFTQPGVFTIDNTNLAARYIVTRRPLRTTQLLRAETNNPPTAGAFRLTFNGSTTADIAFNAPAATVQAALEALPTIGAGNVIVESAPPIGTIPGSSYLIKFMNALATAPQPLITISSGNPPLVGQFSIVPIDSHTLEQDPARSTATGGSFTITVVNATTGVGGTTAPIPWNAGQAVIEASIAAIPAIGANNVMVRAEPPGTILPVGKMCISFVGALAGERFNVTINSNSLVPRPVYTIIKYPNIFIQRFVVSGADINPLPTTTFMVGDTDDEEWVGGFAIIPKDDPLPTDPVQLVIAGTLGTSIPEIGGAVTGSGYLLKVNFVSNSFSVVGASSQYLAASASVDVTGLAVDEEGSVYIGGTVFSQTQVDTAVTPGVFDTTSGVFADGRLLRRNDLFVRKYAADGSLLYSALIGGNLHDRAGGWQTDAGGTYYNSGSTVAVDQAKNLYIVGVSSSFNFPRTRGVYGEVFDANPNVTVTKINSDASEILYSTNLRTFGNVSPSGIAVDTRGNAYVTGILAGNVLFDAGDPQQPQTVNYNAGVQLTADADDSTWTGPTNPDIPSTEGFINVLNSSATELIYGSYLGGFLDERIWGPYVDKFGDVWAMGYTDSFRQYARVSSTGAVTLHTQNGSLPASLITPLAFKSSADSGPGNGLTTLYGPLDPRWPFIPPSPAPAPATLIATYFRDGFLTRFRVGLPAISSVALNPEAVAGGLGATSQGTVTLSQPAPLGGIEILLNISDTAAASFDPGVPSGQTTITIPQGATQGTFTVYTSPVSQPTAVDIRATYEGNFRVGRLTVHPWLSQLVLTPTQVVGGNQVTGRIRLFQQAISDVQVNLTSDNNSLVQFPSGTTVTVPAGFDTITFPVQTRGVAANTVVNVSASLLGVGRTQNLTIEPASIVQVTFSPPRVTGGTFSVGRVTLNGEAGTGFDVQLTFVGGTPPGYAILGDFQPGHPQYPGVRFNPGDTFASFTVVTPYEPVNTQRVIVATRPAQGTYGQSSASGTLFVDAADILSFTINPSTVNGGQSATGTITLNRAAGAGGTRIYLSSDNPNAQVPAQLMVPAGESQVQFQITTNTVGVDVVANITAHRGGGPNFVRALTIRGVIPTLTINPSTVLGGNPSTGTVTLNGPAPAGGVVVALSSNNGAAQVPGSVTINAGQTSANFTITTSVVTSVTQAVISAQVGAGTPSTATLTITPVTILSIEFSPRVVRGGNLTQMTITLDGPAPVGGALVTLQNQNPSIAVIPSSVTIPAGQTSRTVAVTTRRVSRTLATQVTATYNGASVSAFLTVTR